MLTKEQVGGVVRALLTAVAGYAAGKGLIPVEGVAELVSAGVVLVVAVWSIATNKAPKP
mgnify:CR=1 FL=1|tara:strand:+ start:2296 stop:2472 length:177 start_codon:yes stop_codon:yes gene_type:complete